MNLEFTTEIRCSPKELWPWLTEPERMKQWMKGLVRIEPDDPKAVKVGMLAKITIKEGGKLVTYDERILEWESQRRIVISLSTPQWNGLEMIVGYRLEDLGNATLLHYAFECRTTRTLFKVLGALFGCFAKMQAKSFMKSLKRLAESSTARVTAA